MGKEINAKNFLEALAGWGDDADIKPRSYSGRAMYGANCVGVDINGFGEVGIIACALIDAGFDADDVAVFMKRMKWDNMGLGYIVYWPHALALSAEQHEELMAKEYAEEEESI
jgi:hypothetical protein